MPGTNHHKNVRTGISGSIQEFNCRIHAQNVRIWWVDDRGGGSEVKSPRAHNLYRVTLSGSGEVWALDPTGAQFGYTHPLCPWRELETRRSGHGTRIDELGSCSLDQPLGAIFGTAAEVNCAMQELELAESLESMIPEWSRCYGADGRLDGLLRGSNETFDAAGKEFLAKVERHVRDSVVVILAPDKVAGRITRAEAELERANGDPASLHLRYLTNTE